VGAREDAAIGEVVEVAPDGVHRDGERGGQLGDGGVAAVAYLPGQRRAMLGGQGVVGRRGCRVLRRRAVPFDILR
jgi:hypothetical protein